MSESEEAKWEALADLGRRMEADTEEGRMLRANMRKRAEENRRKVRAFMEAGALRQIAADFDREII